MGNSKIFIIKLEKLATKIFILILIVVFSIKLIHIQISNMEKQKELSNIRQKTEDKIQENENLKKQIASDKDDAFVEKYARENLDMSCGAERIFVDVS